MEAVSEPVQKDEKVRACPKPELRQPAAPGGPGTHGAAARGQRAEGLWMCHHKAVFRMLFFW